MIQIYHNPRCRKSREGLALLEDSGRDFEVRKYLEETLDKKEIRELLKKLSIQPIELVRTGEKEWKDHYKGKNPDNEEIIDALARYPKLIERPVVIKEGRAVIGRPVEKIKSLLES